ncbi:YdcF family protein [Bradyrhizobium neotropicale]|uniref:YdcF family protein n=1 Tax=Bradyrhizobium neotropicale TaxID=1497615 RepID=UPI000AD25A6E|nr:YdcF family protein [Bradyrhizobium neotropicale]
MFLLSKTLGALAILPNFLAAIGLFGCLLILTRYVAAGRKLAIGAFVGLAVCGFSPAGSLLLRPLEDRFPPWVPGADAPDGIIILGGSTKPEVSAARGFPVSDIGVDRLITGAMLARRYPNARIIYSGGSPDLLPGNLREADYALQILGELGIPRDRVQIEGYSRNTAENATFSKAAASPKPGDHWLLVTSAYHMPRAVGLFRAAGFPVEPVPTGWLTSGHTTWLDLGNFASSVLLVHVASREWIGLATYRALGRTSAFFPGP